jgi:hypothetical protein
VRIYFSFNLDKINIVNSKIATTCEKDLDFLLNLPFMKGTSSSL